jgi:Domain of Unknown Function (DUF1080)
MIKSGRRHFLATLSGGLPAMALAGQQPAAEPYVPKQSDRPEPATGEEPGFRPIFDGRTLAGWEGDPRYWRVEEGAITGEVTPSTLLKSNTFLIWRGGEPKDFELKGEYRITASGNSGINYRSVSIIDPVTPGHRFALRGYQADIDGQNRYTGQNYEEKGRLFMAERGQLTRIVGGRKPLILSSCGDNKALGALITPGWNSFHLIARGNVLAHIINGHLMSGVIDDDVPNRKSEGLLGVQVHVGPPMKVEYRSLRLKNW